MSAGKQVRRTAVDDFPRFFQVQQGRPKGVTNPLQESQHAVDRTTASLPMFAIGTGPAPTLVACQPPLSPSRYRCSPQMHHVRDSCSGIYPERRVPVIARAAEHDILAVDLARKRHVRCGYTAAGRFPGMEFLRNRRCSRSQWSGPWKPLHHMM